MAILAYHSISPRFIWGITWTTPRQFSSQIRRALDLGFTFHSLDERLKTNDSHAKRLYITFDDGFENIYQYAFPVLNKYKLPATLFVVAGYSGQYNTWDVNWGNQRLCHLDWAQLQELAAAGWTIGSHGMSHSSLPQLSDGKLRRELYSSKALIEHHIQRPCQWLSLPFGNGAQRVLDVAHEAGYRGIVGMSRISSHASLACHARTGVYVLDNSFTFEQKCIAKYKKIYHLIQGMLDICSNGTVWVKQGIGSQPRKRSSLG
ncbi:polysaccharide deacetylase family protein [candidate division KSB1 bacterium]|nr:polysaccharide deacetylase family protein [candidate division KSB1 bacterium]